MSLIFCDGFGHSSSGAYALLKWDAAYSVSSSYWTYGSDYGSDGGYGLRMGVSSSFYMSKDIPAAATVIVGGRWKFNLFSDSNQFLSLVDSDDGTNQIELRAMVDGSIAVYRGGSTLIGQSSSGIMTENVWGYIEIKAVIDSSSGSIEVKLEGQTVISETGINTQESSNAYVNRVRPFSNGSYTYIDDFYICNISGSQCNDFLGAIKIATLFPTSDGNSSDFTPSTGVDNYANVDDEPIDSLTDYNESANVGDKDTYGMTTFSDSGNILGVQVTAAVLNSDAGTMNVRTICRSGDTPTDNEGSDHTLSQSITGTSTIYELEPTDSVAWTATKLNAAEFGIKVES